MGLGHAVAIGIGGMIGAGGPVEYLVRGLGDNWLSGGLILTALLVALIGSLFDLEGIAITGSATFLIVYGAVNGSHLRLLEETGARRWAVACGLLGCIVVFGLLLVYLAQERPAAIAGLLALLAVGFGTDRAWCKYSKRLMATRGD